MQPAHRSDPAALADEDPLAGGEVYVLLELFEGVGHLLRHGQVGFGDVGGAVRDRESNAQRVDKKEVGVIAGGVRVRHESEVVGEGQRAESPEIDVVRRAAGAE